MKNHEKYMQHCLLLAEKGKGSVAPNPMVGCVIVHNETIIGEGYHEQYGGPHAEVNAINAVENKELLKTSTLYVNLEPCSHFGKTPPCADLIIKYQIPKVYIGCFDSHSKVAGKGIQKLRDVNCMVEYPILEKESRTLNRRFFTFHEKHRPYIILKWAESQDGFIDKRRTLNDGNKPTKISCPASSKRVHKWRSEEQAIMVGTATALLDNPKLDVRGVSGNNPLRVVIDKELNIPHHYNLLDKRLPTLVFTSKNKASKSNLEYITISFEENTLPQIMDHLYRRNIQSILVEGGTKLIENFLASNLWDEARILKSSATLSEGVKAPQFNSKGLATEKIGTDDLFIRFPKVD